MSIKILKDGKLKQVSGRFNNGSRYDDITKRFMILKAYKLQLDQLGYIVSDCNIYDKSKMYDLINSGINKQDSNRQYFKYQINSQHINALNAVCRMFKNHETSSKDMMKRIDKAINFDYKDPCHRISQFDLYQVVLNRFMRVAKKKNIDFKIELKRLF